jgi:hypothetical protein
MIADHWSGRQLRFGTTPRGPDLEASLHSQRFTRIMMPTRASANARLVYILMILAYPTEPKKDGGLEGGYEQYPAHICSTRIA